MSSYRDKRASSLLQQEISQLILKDIKDPRITGFITVTHVDVSKDLRSATVYVSILGDKNSKKSSLEGLNNAVGFIKKQLSRTITLKYMPEIRFKEDSSLKEASTLYNKIVKIENAEKNMDHSDAALNHNTGNIDE
ncbi:MAG: 30S ribosome-binding factor RbfA [Spirochaetota bacterium]|nr:30S ribosome-binding factor RbfA [Spirochaetota bacterium]